MEECPQQAGAGVAHRPHAESRQNATNRKFHRCVSGCAGSDCARACAGFTLAGRSGPPGAKEQDQRAGEESPHQRRHFLGIVLRSRICFVRSGLDRLARRGPRHAERASKEEVEAEVVQYVVNTGYATDLTDDEVEYIGRDPFLIAYGFDNPERCIVTAEQSKPGKRRHNRQVPDVLSQSRSCLLRPVQDGSGTGFSDQLEMKLTLIVPSIPYGRSGLKDRRLDPWLPAEKARPRSEQPSLKYYPYAAPLHRRVG